MNITQVNYTAKQNTNKRPSFGMNITPEALKLIQDAPLNKKTRNMVQLLQAHNDSFTLQIVKKGEEFLPGLSHQKYKQARELFPLDDNDYCRRYIELEQYPHVHLFEATPTASTSITKDGLVKSETYKEIKYSLPEVINGIYREFFGGENFKRHVNRVLKPRHLENNKIVTEAKQEYKEIMELLKKGEESGRIDKNGIKEINKTIKEAYDGGKLYLSTPYCPPCCEKRPDYLIFENNLSKYWYKENIANIVNSKMDNPFVITAKAAKKDHYPNEKTIQLFAYNPESPEKMELIGHSINYSLEAKGKLNLYSANQKLNEL